ncbi:zinc finger protein 629 isoform X1 [Ixodes scapularis]|uniref:zinc finger protein 629 isoform X1 n=1 Tax=Ixodes scapularis TaxID=6945 RepID=UPI001AD7E24E|nr:zinc finger protein 629 isoform X1 [Ixodes scapularis]XP_042150363.1 zinc finger protein 629 isoform X1 [Ixodes scapularis]
MVQRCCVPFCKRKSKRGSIAFHEFPADLKLCQKWIKAIHHEGFTLHIDSQRVCSDHFKQTDYIEGKKRRFLIKGSVPSIFPKCSGNLPPNQASTSVHQTIQEQNDSSSSLQRCPLPTINTGENQCENLHSASHQPLWSSLLGDCGLPAKAWGCQASTKQTLPSLPAQLLGPSTLNEHGLPTEADSQDQTLLSSVDQSLGLSPLGEHGLPAKAWDSQASTKQTVPSSTAQPLGSSLLGEHDLPAKAWGSQASTKQTVPSSTAEPLGLSPLDESGLPAKACSSQAATKQTLPSLAAEPLGDGATLLGETSCPLKVTENIWFGCCSCTYVTSDQRVIVSHLAAHGDEQAKCQHPSMSGSDSQVLSNTQKHKSEKPFKCKHCPLAFAYNSLLTCHNRTHTGEKPFKCKQCPQAFAQNSYLTNHNRMHTGEKPFKCKQCPQAFAQNSYLRNHIRMHTGEKPFRCKLCSKAFSYNRSLIHHYQTHCLKTLEVQTMPQELFS